jgi:hypothetical protein
VVRDPLQARRGQHEIVVGGRRPRSQVAELEVHVRRDVLGGLVEHCLRVVDASHLADSELRGGQCGQLSRAATEIDRSLDRVELDQRQQVVERLSAFSSESTVLLGVPVSHDLYRTCI